MTNWRNQAIAKIQGEIDRVRANYAEAALDAAIEAVIEQLRSRQSQPKPPVANENTSNPVQCKTLPMNGDRYNWRPLRELAVGGSVLMPYRTLRASSVEKERAKRAAYKAASDWRKTTGYRFANRVMPDGIRIWRIA